ncbi:uncharacterized protein P174DRAFT_439322 [Aspergillus novofumigatus IBT 16806]|uniref:Squalene/phytoene synthase n=1 Tax=Aspergillus novofumigatus (strain IBT 16806) TaxID=1392255 RepID=A0A2I1CIU2_ASPN1|nr:uncharacterized protein P174DRAFT_439322 [Aspergillus novofumigatus IBT 16806]PKX97556.1 hypothetical protein P174DRAFT_439322 [Aspergillus novofumigatus IBT 16806]
MSLLEEIARACRARARSCPISQVRVQPQQRRHLSRSAPAASPVSGAAEAEVQAARKYCSDLLLKYDRPSYTLSTFIPQKSQTSYLALRALNVTLSMIPETTSSYTIGLMRLQFWRDAVAKILAADLNERTQGQARISKAWLNKMINAREQTLTNDPYPTVAALETYAENTYSTLLYLTLSSLPMTSISADHVASHIGKAAGIAAVLRGLPLVAFPPPQAQSPTQPASGNFGGTKQGAVMLPLDVMAQAGVKEEDVFRMGGEAPGLRDAVFTVATRASDHLITVQQMLSNLRAGQDVGHDFEHAGEEGHEYLAGRGQRDESPLDEVNRAFGVFLPAVSTRLWLDRLQKVDFDIFRPELLRSDWRLPWKAYLAFNRKSL